MKRIVLGTAVAREPVLAALRDFHEIDLIQVDGVADVAPMIAEADALIISDPRGNDGDRIACELNKPGCGVKWVQMLTAGVQGLARHDLPDDLVLTNQGGAVAPAVAEFCMAMILAMARPIPEIYRRSARGEWRRDFDPMPMSLEGRTLVIVGFGHIGRQLAKRARAFDMKIIGLSRTGAAEPLADEMHPLSDLHEQLGRADVVAVCIASVPSTHHIMDEAAFHAVRRGALFANVTRGETVDANALRTTLESGRLRAAAIDVTDPEPLPDGDALWSAPNLVISPHVAGLGGTGTAGRIAGVVAENTRRFIEGAELKYRVEL